MYTKYLSDYCEYTYKMNIFKGMPDGTFCFPVCVMAQTNKFWPVFLA